MSDRIPGSSWDNPIWHRGWRIYVGDPQIDHRLAYAYSHDDYDGAEDSQDDRAGYARSVDEAIADIDEREDEATPLLTSRGE